MAPRVLLVLGDKVVRKRGWQDNHATGFVQSSTASISLFKPPEKPSRVSSLTPAPQPRAGMASQLGGEAQG